MLRYVCIVTGCFWWASAHSEPLDNCHTADTLTLDHITVIIEQPYSVVRRVSGFQDKVVFFELYPLNTSFNACRQSSVDALDIVVLPENKSLHRLVVQDAQLQMQFCEDIDEACNQETPDVLFKP